jgi:hypothetical protein
MAKGQWIELFVAKKRDVKAKGPRKASKSGDWRSARGENEAQKGSQEVAHDPS